MTSDDKPAAQSGTARLQREVADLQRLLARAEELKAENLRVMAEIDEAVATIQDCPRYVASQQS